MTKTIETEVEKADKIVNNSLNLLIETYKIDDFEVKTNYLRNFYNALLNSKNQTAVDIVYAALDKTLKDYEAIYRMNEPIYKANKATPLKGVYDILNEKLKKWPKKQSKKKQ